MHDMSGLKEAMQWVVSLHQLHQQGARPYLYSIQVDTGYKSFMSPITNNSKSDRRHTGLEQLECQHT
jgi:hypothetical protein